MIRILLFILLVFAIGFGFAWLADMPGQVVVTVAGQEIAVELITAAVLLLAAIVAVMFVWWVLKVILTSPQRTRRFFRARKRDRGYQSLSTGIIAAGSGDSTQARRMLKQANGLLNSTTEPLLQLLDAQTTLLEGDHDAARKKFEAMLDDPEMRELGLRGLYIEAERVGDREAQRHYAEKAAEIAPQLGWASDAALDHKTAAGDWEGAIRLLDGQKSRKQIDKDEANRKRAVLLTAMAMEKLEAEPAKAKSAALEAHKLQPAFAPAAVVAAEACQRLNDLRRGVKVLETTWRAETHPDVALAYVNARPGDSAIDRLKRARRLEELRPNNTESSLIVAQMALEAGEYEDSRKAVAGVLRNEPRESAYMLMADIEEAETGHQGKVREWLARAVRAPRDPAWTADGYVAQKWAPFSPITGQIDAFEWKVPVEQIGGPLIENDLDPMQRGVSPGLGSTMDAAGAGVVTGAIIDAAIVEAESGEAATVAEVTEETAPTEAVASDPAVLEPVVLKPKTDLEARKMETAAKLDERKPDFAKKTDKSTASKTSAAEPEEEADTADAPQPSKASEETLDAESTTDAPQPERATVKQAGTVEAKAPIPDDPGIADDEEVEKPRGFRLF